MEQVSLEVKNLKKYFNTPKGPVSYTHLTLPTN